MSASTTSDRVQNDIFETLAAMRTGWKVAYAVLGLWLVATLAWKPSLLVSQLISGFMYGMVLVLIALGLSLILGLMGVINFAHGALFMFGAYFAFAAVAQFGLPFWAALVTAPIGVAVVGAFMEYLFVRRLYGEDPLSIVLLTFGLLLMFEESVRYIWGTTPLVYDRPAILSSPISLGFTSVSTLRVVTVLIGALMVLLVYLLIERTDFGLSIRAGVQDAEAAEIIGVNLPIRFTAMFALGSALAGLGGVLYSAEVGLETAMAGDFIVIAFVVVVVGGMGSLFGSVVSGLLIGLVRFVMPTMVDALGAFIGIEALSLGGFAGALPYLLMIIVLLDRPRGLFGREDMFE